MKKNLGWLFALTVLVLVLLFLAGGAYSQQLWGMTSDGGGKKTGGNIFSIQTDGTGFTEHYPFFNDGQAPGRQRLLNYGDGFLYGLAGNILYRHLFDGSSYKAVYVFQQATGMQPDTRLLKGQDGYLYGTTTYGGNNNMGVIYKIQKNGTGYTVLHHFNGVNGLFARGNLLQFNNGLLCGTTERGGLSDNGVVYRINPDGSGFQVLHSFSGGTSGENPEGGVVALTVGGTTYLYGVTRNGGNNGLGVIYRMEPDGTNFSRQFNFSTSSGHSPRGPLIKIGNILYGVTRMGGNNGGGVIFAYDADADSYQKLRQFTYDPFYSIEGVLTGPLLNINGVLYGTTEWGGNFSWGVLYKINTDGSGYQVIHQFEDENGSSGNLAWINNQLYGLTFGGDSNPSNTFSGGTIYRVNTDGTGFQTIHSFNDANGYEPHGSLILAQDGNLYGLTTFGGSGYSNGLAFTIQSDGTNFTPLQWLANGAGAGRPHGSLVQASNGNFYGMTELGNADFTGMVFRLAMNIAQIYETYYRFCLAPDCAYNPTGSLIQASDGHLYGMTPYTGQGTGQGNIFRIATNGTHYTSIKILNGSSEGANPKGSLVQAPDGFLYGMTENGGSNGFGVIFKIKTDGTGFQTIFQFGSNMNALYGAHPKGSLLLGSDGKLYGMAYAGGSVWLGTIFRINTSGTGFTVLHNFNGTNGAFPVASLVEDASTGYLFGMTKEGGTNSLGTIFKIRKDGTGFQKLLDFDGANGKYPLGDLLIVPTPAMPRQRTLAVAKEENGHINIYPNPVQHSITISFPGPVKGKIFYSLQDVQGRKLVVQATSSGPQVRTIDVSFLPAGMYLLEIATGEKKITKKIFKQ